MKHTRTSSLSFEAFKLTINGESVAGGVGGLGRTTCSCGWDSGVMKSGDAAQTAFEEHAAAATARRSRRG
jgi:hypothetical protein